MTKRKQSITERQQFWLDHIKAADSSGGSRVAYAAEHNLSVKHLYQWKTALRRLDLLPGRKAPERSFVAVTHPPLPTAPINCSVILPNGVRLQIAGALDAATLVQILSAANSVS